MRHFALWALGLALAETQTTQAERDCLTEHARGRRRLAEIGVWHGVTTNVIRRAMAADGVLLAIDPFPAGRLGFSIQKVIAGREVNKVSQGRVRWLRVTGIEAAKSREVYSLGGIDFIFIDGDHSYDGLRGDWEAWSPLVTPGGHVALHDSCSSATRNIEDAGSVKFTQEVIRKDHRFQIVKVIDTLTVLRRRWE